MNEADNGMKSFPIYVVSGGKGIAGYTMVHSLVIQYPDHKFSVNIIPNVQSESAIVEVVTKIKETGGILTHTMVNSDLRAMLIKECKLQGIKEIDFMGPLADFLEKEMGFRSINVPGLYRRINAQYFDRIEAIEYAMNHDDGMDPERILQAEIVLTGVSRSGKTPLSVYMSMFGWKVANVPLVKGIDPPKELFMVDPKRVFGLIINENYLIAQRHKRLQRMGNIENTAYVDSENVREELRFANLIIDRGGFTKINVTNKPIETSANEIIGMVSDSFGHPDRGTNEPEA